LALDKISIINIYYIILLKLEEII